MTIGSWEPTIAFVEKHTLVAQKRSLSGRKVKQLRKQGILPANVYGKKVASQSVQIPLKTFSQVFAKAGETGLIELDVDGKKHPVLIHNIQYDPVSETPIHADLFQVDLHEKVEAKVPVVLRGESPAVKDKVGVLLTLLDEVEVEALPADLPDKIEVDTSSLTTLDQVIKVGDLRIARAVKILTNTTLDVVKVAPLVSKEAEKMAAEEAAAAAAAAAAATAAETPAEGVGAPTPAEGEKAAETDKTPPKEEATK